MVSDLHFERMKRCIETSGGDVVFGGKKLAKDVKHVEPTIIVNPKLDAEIMTDEIFGPLLPIITYKHFDEVIDFINERDKPLATYYYGDKNGANCKRVIDETSSGGFMTNDCIMHVISHYAGFGGVGASGYGRYHGFEGFKQFSNRKGCLLKGPNSDANNRMAMAPFTEEKKKQIRCAGPYLAYYTQWDACKLLIVVFGVLATITYLGVRSVTGANTAKL